MQMIRRMTRRTAAIGSFALALALSASSGAWATPLYDYFGPLNEATFGGTGIPNDEVAVASQFEDGDVEITVAMSATQRYDNPALTNDGAGTYFAGPGSNIKGPDSLEGALWNFNYFIRVVGLNGATPKLSDYQFDMYYDFDTGLDTAKVSLGIINMTAGVLGSPTPLATLAEGSENLLFAYLTAGIPGVVTPPPSGSFDADALGEYNFGIEVSRGGWSVEAVRMDVQVVPEPTTALLMACGLAGLAAAGRRRSVH